MAIEWTIESGSAISPGQLVRATTKALGAVLGTAPGGVRVDGDLAEGPAAEFELTLRVAFGDAEGVAEVSSDHQLDDDGTPDPELIYATVTAYRTQLSAAVAVVTAVALAELARGELSGPGLDRRYRWPDLDGLVRQLSAEPGVGMTDAVARLASRFGWTTLPAA